MSLRNAKWWDSGEFRPAYSSVGLEIQPPGYVEIRTNLVLVTVPSATFVNDGDSVTFKATLTVAGVDIVGEDVLLQESIAGVWTTVGTDTTDVNGECTYTFVPAATTVYRAYFAGVVTSYVAATSSSYPLTVRTQQTVTQRFNSTWDGIYGGGGALITGSSGSGIQQSDRPSTGGGVQRYKTLIGFNATAIATFFEGYISTESVTFSLRFTDRVSGEDIIVCLGSHNKTSKPSSYPGTGTYEDLSRAMRLSRSISLPTRDSEEITTMNGVSTGDRFSTGAWTGLVVGPPPSDNTTYYFRANDGSDNDALRPWIEFTIVKWA